MVQVRSIDELLSPAEVAAIEQPIAAARSLPRRAFFDPDFYAFEVTNLLTRSWLAVAFCERVAGVGAALPLCILGQPIVLVRNGAGRLRAFHNVVPYDGAEVIIEPATGLAEIVTPYHGHVYDLDGRLIRAPFWDGTPDGGDVAGLRADLVPVACEEWFGTVFVHLGPDPETFASHLAPVLEHFADYQLERLRIGRDEDGRPVVHELECRANWKTMYENYSPNVYHESFVHDMYRRSPHSPRVDRDGRKTYREVIDSRGFLGLTYENHVASSFVGELPTLPPVRLRDGSPSRVNHIINMYPNWVITVLGNQARMAFMLPEGPERCRQFIATYFDESIVATAAQAADRRRAWTAGLKGRHEDNAICESVQRARRSPAIDSQFFNPFWDAPHHALTRMLLRLYRTGRRA